MSSQLPILSIVIWLPILGGIAVLAAGDRRPVLARQLSLAVAIATFVASIPLWTGFDTRTGAMQFVERHPWIETFNVYSTWAWMAWPCR